VCCVDVVVLVVDDVLRSIGADGEEDCAAGLVYTVVNVAVVDVPVALRIVLEALLSVLTASSAC